MLRGAPRTLVWDTDFVRGCLRAADACGAESLTAMQSALHSAVFTGGRSAAIGQPYPEDLEQRDTAAKLATQAVPGSVEEQFYRALSQSAEHGSTWTYLRSTFLQTVGTGSSIKLPPGLDGRPE